MIHQIYSLAEDYGLAGHVAFIENYEIHAAHFFTQGVDIWLNNPRAPLEACGTSGQKAGMNGAINVSVLDGWWYEGYNGDNGWAIGDPPEDSRYITTTRLTQKRSTDFLNNKSCPFTTTATRTVFRTDGFKWRRNRSVRLCRTFLQVGCSRSMRPACTCLPAPKALRPGRN